jgi:hypothetical protein
MIDRSRFFIAVVAFFAPLTLFSQSGPAIRIESPSTGQIRISWSSAASGFQLQETPALGSGWHASAAAPIVVNNEYVLTLAPAGTPKFFRLAGAGGPLTEITSSSPADGESGVAVTRETVLRFSAPLAADTMLTTDNFYVGYAGRKLLSRVELSSDRRTATLFYLEPLPGGTRIYGVFDGTGMADESGRFVDADDDGIPGGIGLFSFETLATTPVTGTVVTGQVFASESAGGDVPLENVTVTVDGAEETIRATTDSQGRFTLANTPSGRFFVHVDGRTVTQGIANSQLRWDQRDYYPFVGKAWEAMAGKTNLAGGTGLIYLPLIRQGTLQTVSATAPTAVTFPDAVLAAQPNLRGVEITVPPNDLLAENGTRGGSVGIAPVPPDRLPEPLPAGLKLPLVITIQTDGPQNFDRPVPVKFPNLPDPVTGKKLAPGEKSALWSFNHDTGVWEIAGPMTVSADGNFVVSDPGFGVLQPGWHGTQPGVGAGGGPLGGPPCPTGGGPGKICKQNPNFIPDDPANYNGCGPDGWDYVVPDNPNFPYFCASFYDACKAHDIGYNTCGKPKQDVDDKFLRDMLAACDCIDDPIDHAACVGLANLYFKGVTGGGAGAWDAAQQQACICQEPPGCGPSSGGGGPGPGAGRVSAFAVKSEGLPSSYVPQTGPHHFAVVDVETKQVVQRGRAGTLGIAFAQLILQPNKTYDIGILQDATLWEGHVRIQTGASGTRLEIPPIAVEPPSSWDFDGDGLHDVGELIMGTDPRVADSDHDGIDDGTEVKLGLNALGDSQVATGVIASADTPGIAVDVSAVNNVVAVADSEAGVSIYDVRGITPILMARVDTAGSARRVAWDGTMLAVADGNEGLAIMDVRVAERAAITHQLRLGNATAVAAAANLAYAGFESGVVAVVDMSSGAVLRQVTLGEPVRDLVFGGDYLYALTVNKLFAMDPRDGDLEVRGSAGSPVISSPNSRLNVGGGVAYAVHGKGFNTFDLTNPEQPALLKGRNTAQFGWEQIVPNGSGLGVAAVGTALAFDQQRVFSLYDLKDPKTDAQFVASYAHPGQARAVSIYNGLAYGAAHDAGLLVINYLAFDTAGKPPTVYLSANFSLSAGLAEEGKVMRLTANVTDDVQVRNVEFYVDDNLIAVDGNFPFEQRFVTPRLAQQQTFKVRAKATDTGGNSTWSDEFTIRLVADATPPRIARSIPANGGGTGKSSTVAAIFSEPIDQSKINAANFFVVSSGPDGKFGTADDVVMPNASYRYEVALNAVYLTFPTDFAPGTYQFVIRTTVSDLAGNALAQESRSTFTAGLGLTGEYYDNIDFTELKLTRIDPTVDFDWSGGSPDPVLGPDQFSIRWRGFVVPKFSEDYTLYTVSDDGVRLWIDDQLVINNWSDHGATENPSAPLKLVAGQAYSVRMDFYENGGAAVAKLLWSSASQGKEAIPGTQLLPYEDRIKPFALAAFADPSFQRVRLHFSETLEAISSADRQNYSMSGGISVLSAELQPNRTDVVLTTTRQSEGTPYTVTINGVRDASDQFNPIAANSQVNFTSFVTGQGFLRREVYTGVSQGTVDALRNLAKFPDSPDAVEFIDSFETPSNWGEYYGQRVSGYVVPPISGDYVFYIDSDDQSTLLLSTDEDPANARTIAFEPQWNPPRLWLVTDRRSPTAPENRSQPITLQAGKRYYIEALMAEGYGGDNLAVTWQRIAPQGSYFVIEAEDFDFAGGQHLSVADQTPYFGGAYTNRDGIKGVDYDGLSGGGAPYRPGDPEVGMVDSPDRQRLGHIVTTNYKVGWNDAGDWYNYTRTFQAGAYNVYAQIASGGAAMSARFEEVTSGRGTPQQTLQKLGEFNAPASGGWDTFVPVPLKDDKGNLLALNLSGERTLRFTVQPGNLDFNYLLFVSASAGDLSTYLPPTNGAPPIGGKDLATYSSPDGTGFLTRQVYRDIPGAEVDKLTSSPKFPNHPDETTYVPRFEAPSNYADAYGQRIFGYLTAPVTGDYRFFLASDDNGQLFLSTDESPANKKLIAMEASWTSSRAWLSARPESRSGPISLVGGRKYYIEALMKEITGADNLGVAWQIPGLIGPVDGGDPIPGVYLSVLSHPQPVSFTLVPQSQSVPEESPLTLSASALGAPPLRYQWFKNGAPIEGATQPSYTIASTRVADSGSFSVEVASLTGKTRTPDATLTVVPDLTAPALVSARGDIQNRLVLTFTEELDQTTAEDPLHYTLSGGLGVSAATLLPSKKEVRLATSTQTQNTSYTVSVKGVTDDAPTRNVIAPNSSANFTSFVITRGFLNREVYKDIGGGALTDLTNSRKYPNWPDEESFVDLFETPPNVLDNYGVRLSGFVLPPVSGPYIFYMASDDQGALFLSTDEDPAHKSKIAFEPSWNSSRVWLGGNARNPAAPENRSQPITLEAGKRYYTEAIMKEGGGGDDLGVTWQVPGQIDPPQNGSDPIHAAFLAGYGDPTSTGLSVTQQPASAIVKTGAKAVSASR